MNQSPIPASTPSRRKVQSPATTATIAISLTLLAGDIAFLAGLVPIRSMSVGERLDIGSVLFVVPLAALMLAVIFEASRIALRPSRLPRQARPRQVVRWSPGRGEG